MEPPELLPSIAVGVLAGTVARLTMLRIDYRQYPSYPQGFTIHVSLGFIASLLGAMAIPALVSGDFAAASFLALAATQFREVRSVERDTLTHMESHELVPRGAPYIEGIARVFEARNYLAMLVSLVASGVGLLASGMGWAASAAAGAAAGGIAILIVRKAMRGPTIGDIADVKIGEIHFDGPLLTIGDVSIMNVGLEDARQRYMREGIALIIEPRNVAAKEMLANVGQRQAIAHEVAARVGIEKDVDQPEFTPLPRRSPVTGTIVMAIIPTLTDKDAIVEAVRQVPLLEAVTRRPHGSKKGRTA